MYKVEKCGDEFWCILDVQTTMPPLLSFRWLESQLKENALGTQKSYMDSLKLFYDFWLQKHGVSLDSAFFKVVVIIRLVIKRLFFLDLDEPHQRVHSS